MKNKIYYFGIISLLVLFIGAMFKLLHWPAAGIIITLGFAMFTLVFIPVALINSYNETKEKKKRFLYILVFVCILVVCAGALFKIMHWPGATIFLVIGVPLPFVLFLPAYLTFINKSKQINYTHLIFILFFFAYYGVITAFLSLNVSKDLITDALIASEYLEKKANLLDKQTDMLISLSLPKADDSLKLMNALNKRNELNRRIDNLLSEFTRVVEIDNPRTITKQEKINLWEIKGKDMTLSFRQAFDEEIVTLKNGITEFKYQLASIIPKSETETASSIQKLLDTDEDAWNGEKNIFNQPLIFVIQSLKQIKKEISIATYEAASAIEEKSAI